MHSDGRWHSHGRWEYDEETGEITTSDNSGDWSGRQYTLICTVNNLDGIHNGPLLAAAYQMFKDLIVTAALLRGLGHSNFADGLDETIAMAKGESHALR